MGLARSPPRLYFCARRLRICTPSNTSNTCAPHISVSDPIERINICLLHENYHHHCLHMQHSVPPLLVPHQSHLLGHACLRANLPKWSILPTLCAHALGSLRHAGEITTKKFVLFSVLRFLVGESIIASSTLAFVTLAG